MADTQGSPYKDQSQLGHFHFQSPKRFHWRFLFQSQSVSQSPKRFHLPSILILSLIFTQFSGVVQAATTTAGNNSTISNSSLVTSNSLSGVAIASESNASKNNQNSSAGNASSLFFASLEDDSRQPLRRVAALAPEGVLAKNAVRVFLTLEPNIASNLTTGNDLAITSTDGNNLISGSNLSAGNNLNITSLKGATTITAAQDRYFKAVSTVDQSYGNIALEYEHGRLSLSSESNVKEVDSKSTSVTQASSNLTSGLNYAPPSSALADALATAIPLNRGNINITTKDDINILSSNLTSNNQINLNSTEGSTNILANDNTAHSDTEIREGTLKLSVGINNVFLDAAYAVDDTVKATEALKAAKENLDKMKDLKKQGKADSEAVDDAQINLQIALLNLNLAVLKAAAAAEKTRNTGKTFGFYFDLKLTRTGDKTNIATNNVDEIASSLLAKNTILITSGSALTAIQAKDNDTGNTNIKGSIASQDGDITIISKGDTDITASKSTSSSNMRSKGFTQTVTMGASYGKSSMQTLVESLAAQISIRSSKSQADNTSYNNTTLTAENGNIIINSGNFNAPPSSALADALATLNHSKQPFGAVLSADAAVPSPLNRGNTTIKGAELLAENITLNTGNNLDIESLQNRDHSKSKSTSVGVGGGKSSASLSYNASRSKFDRDWVDDQTSIIGTNSVNINTGANTNLKGALIANIINATLTDITKQGQDAKDSQKGWIDGGNLTLNTGTLTFENIYDIEKQKSSSIGLALNANFGAKDNTQIGPKQENNYYPKGSVTIALQNEGYEKNQTTKATVGAGTITTGSNLVLNFDANGNLLSKTGGTTLANNDPTLAGLNRDVTNTQEITKDTITGALNVNTTIDLRLLDIT